MPDPTTPPPFDAFVIQLLHRAAGRTGGGVETLYDRWRAGRTGGESFLDHLTARGVVDRIGSRAVLMAWDGGLDVRDARQVFDAEALRRTLAREVSADDLAPAPRPAEFRAIGSRVGRYAIKGVLGRGGFGPVYLSTHPTLRVPVAVKPVGGDPAARDALRAEARRQAGVSHANVVRVWDYEDGDDPFLVLEYVPGESLRDRLTAGPLGRREAFALIVQAAAGLRAALKAGVTHHDVKPANVLLTAEDGFKLGDFGLARCRRRFVRAADVASDPSPRRAFGTWVYAAPEQFDGGGDHRSDIYALGMTAYHALAGRPAVSGAGPDELMLAHKRGDHEPLHRAAPGVGWGVSDLISRMTAADPDRRFHGYDDLIRAAEAAFALRLDLY